MLRKFGTAIAAIPCFLSFGVGATLFDYSAALPLVWRCLLSTVPFVSLALPLSIVRHLSEARMDVQTPLNSIGESFLAGVLFTCMGIVCAQLYALDPSKLKLLLFAVALLSLGVTVVLCTPFVALIHLPRRQHG